MLENGFQHRNRKQKQKQDMTFEQFLTMSDNESMSKDIRKPLEKFGSQKEQRKAKPKHAN